MKIKMYQWVLFGFVFLMSAIVMVSCKEEEPEPYDYRSEVMGVYIGTVHRVDTNFTTQEGYDTTYADTVKVIEGTANDRIDIGSEQFTLGQNYYFTRYYTQQSGSSSGSFGGVGSGTVTMTHTTSSSFSSWSVFRRFTGTRR